MFALIIDRCKNSQSQSGYFAMKSQKKTISTFELEKQHYMMNKRNWNFHKILMERWIEWSIIQSQLTFPDLLKLYLFITSDKWLNNK